MVNLKTVRRFFPDAGSTGPGSPDATNARQVSRVQDSAANSEPKGFGAAVRPMARTLPQAGARGAKSRIVSVDVLR